MLRRYPDWPVRLEQCLLKSLAQRFQYGRFDCCLFVADAVIAMTGTDLAARWRNRYRSKRGALDLCSAYAGKESVASLIACAMKEHGVPEVVPPLAQRGDIVLVKRASDHSLGILSLSGREVLNASAQGWVRLPLSLALRAWRV